MTAPVHDWTFRAAHREVVDGDTVKLTVDLGFRLRYEDTVRLLGVAAPELRGKAMQAGWAARDWVSYWMTEARNKWRADDWPLLIRTHKLPSPAAGVRSDKYGRVLAVVYRRHDGECLNDAIVAAGLAKAWDGTGEQP